MRARILIVNGLFLFAACASALTQSPQDLVNLVVQSELAASRNDHSHWLYYDTDRKPAGTTRQWVAETGSGSVDRVLLDNGRPTTPATQRNSIERFIHDPDAQAKQRKSGQHDDKQSEDLLRLLPSAFRWTLVSDANGTTQLHFTPDPAFRPPTWASRVFAAMEGDMRLDDAQHRIISLKGHLIRDVKFCSGLCGSIHAGGTFNVERRQLAPSIWQITETHVHINGQILFFKSISEQEDEVKTQHHQLPGDLSLQKAETVLMQQSPDPAPQQTARSAARPLSAGSE